MFGFAELRSFRPPDLQPNRVACNWLLGASALALTLHVVRLPLWLTAMAFSILFWHMLIENYAPGVIERLGM